MASGKKLKVGDIVKVFVNSSSNREADYLGEGIVEEANKLSRTSYYSEVKITFSHKRFGSDEFNATVGEVRSIYNNNLVLIGPVLSKEEKLAEKIKQLYERQAWVIEGKLSASSYITPPAPSVELKGVIEAGTTLRSIMTGTRTASGRMASSRLEIGRQDWAQQVQMSHAEQEQEQLFRWTRDDLAQASQINPMIGYSRSGSR